MKLFLISQTENNDFETYDSAVVAAPDEETARNMDPATGKPVDKWGGIFSTWADGPECVIVKYLGETEVDQGVICASYGG